MRAVTTLALFCPAVVLGITGCAISSPSAYQRRVEMHELAEDVGVVENGYRLISQEQTQGRFACSLAIAKLWPTEQEAPVLDLVELSHADEAWWSSAVRGVSELRDLQFLSPISVRPEEATTETLCAAAGARGATLLLIYTPNRYGPNSAQVLGVLYDVKTCQPLATLHSSARFADEEGFEVALEGQIGDHRDKDACYQAARTFEEYLRKCFGALILKDDSSPTTQPHRWETPIEQRWWLPRCGRRG